MQGMPEIALNLADIMTGEKMAGNVGCIGQKGDAFDLLKQNPELRCRHARMSNEIIGWNENIIPRTFFRFTLRFVDQNFELFIRHIHFAGEDLDFCQLVVR